MGSNDFVQRWLSVLLSINFSYYLLIHIVYYSWECSSISSFLSDRIWSHAKYVRMNQTCRWAHYLVSICVRSLKILWYQTLTGSLFSATFDFSYSIFIICLVYVYVFCVHIIPCNTRLFFNEQTPVSMRALRHLGRHMTLMWRKGKRGPALEVRDGNGSLHKMVSPVEKSYIFLDWSAEDKCYLCWRWWRRST
jgi:hypothetical protein